MNNADTVFKCCLTVIPNKNRLVVFALTFIAISFANIAFATFTGFMFSIKFIDSKNCIDVSVRAEIIAFRDVFSYFFGFRFISLIFNLHPLWVEIGSNINVNTNIILHFTLPLS